MSRFCGSCQMWMTRVDVNVYMRCYFLLEEEE